MKKTGKTTAGKRATKSTPVLKIYFQESIQDLHRASETIKLVAQHCPSPIEQTELSEIVKLISVPDGDALLQIGMADDCRKLEAATSRLNDILPDVAQEFRPSLEEALEILESKV